MTNDIGALLSSIVIERQCKVEERCLLALARF